MTNPFLKRHSDNLLEGVEVGDRIFVKWFLDSAGLGGPQEMGPIAFEVTSLEERWVGLRAVKNGAYFRLPKTAFRSVQRAD